jgi:hypothetical protein
MTDNVMAKRKRRKEQTMIYKTLHRKLKMQRAIKWHRLKDTVQVI